MKSGIVGLNIGGIIIGFGRLEFIINCGGRKGMFMGFHWSIPGNKGKGVNGGIKWSFAGNPVNAPGVAASVLFACACPQP